MSAKKTLQLTGYFMMLSDELAKKYEENYPQESNRYNIS